MKLFMFSVSCISAQMVSANLFLNGFGFAGWLFFLGMAITAHMVIEIADKTSLDRDRGFMTLVMCHFAGEVYLFALAASEAVDITFPIYSFLYDNGINVMLTLTVVSLASSSLTPILNNTGKIGVAIGIIIDRLYSAVMHLPYHKIRS